MHTVFSGFTPNVCKPSPNCLPVLYEKGQEKYFVKLVDKKAAIAEGLQDIELRLKNISNDHIVKLINYGELNNGYMYLQFEYIEGTTLEEMDKPFPETEIIKAAHDIVDAIDELWKNGIVHRDIKPKNIMKDVVNDRYILLDLGIGYFVQNPYRDNTKSKSNGSRFYSAPEQFLSNQDDSVEITFATDEFSLGLVLFEAATNVHPYKDFDQRKHNNYGAAVSKMDPPKLEEYRDDLNGDLVVAINTMLNTEPVDRFRSMNRMHDALDGKTEDKTHSKLKIFVQDTEDRAGYTRLDSYIESSDDKDKPDGVMVSISNGGADRIKSLIDRNLEVIVDPMTCRLPYRDASTANIKSKLKLEKNKIYTPRYISPNLEEIARKTTLWQKDATSIVLPYFAVRDSDDDYLQFNKAIWKAGRDLVDETIDIANKKVYGGIV
ncbi:MAG: protein kinase, partial [Desulfosporosinus sp.]